MAMTATTTLYQNNLQNNIQDHNGMVDQSQYLSTFFCRALYDYQSRDASSLSFHRGDIIEVLTQLESGWWDGLLHDERGWFPSNYVSPVTVQEIEEELRAVRSDQQEEEWVREQQHVEPAGPPSDFWMPEVANDGRIFYVNTQTGERSSEIPTDAEHEPESIVSTSFTSQTAATTATANSARYTLTSAPTQSVAAGFGLPKRSGTPEPWVKRLADDGMSYYYLNTIDKSVRWTVPSPQLDRPINNILDPFHSPDQRRRTDSFIKGDKLSIYSDDSDNNPRGILGRTAFTEADPMAAATTPTPRIQYEDAPGTLQARELQSFLQEQFAPAPKSLNDLAQAAKASITDLLDIVLSGENDKVKGGIKFVTDSIRDLVYASATLLGPLSLPRPYVNSAHPQEVSSRDLSELKQYHRKVSATMIKLVSAVRAAASDGQNEEDLPARLETDATELERAITTFADEVLRRRNPHQNTRRVHAAFLSVDGPKGIGLSLYGASAAGEWKGFGFVEPLDGEMLGPNILTTIKQYRVKLDDALVDLDASPSATSKGEEVVRHIVQFLALVSDVNVARSIDVDSASNTVVDPSYIQSVTRARDLVRALEACVQAIFDDGADLLHSIQSTMRMLAAPSPQHRSMKDLLSRIPALRNNTAETCATLEALIEIATYQADACAKAGVDRAIGVRDTWLHYYSQRDTIHGDMILNDTQLPPSDADDVVDLDDAFGTRPPTGNREQGTLGASRRGHSDTSIDKLLETVKAEARNHSNSQVGSSMDQDNAVSHATTASQSDTLVSQEISPSDDDEFEDDNDSVLGTKSPPKAHKIKKVLGFDAPDAYINMANADSKPPYLRAEYGAKDIMINPDGSVRGGTLPALIERLTMHDTRDANFINTFLVTLKSFTTLDEVFDSLVKRFNIQPPAKLTTEELKEWTEQKQVVVRLRVINIFKSIVMDDDVLEKEDVHILDRIKAFASTVENDISPPIPAIKQLLVLVDRAQSGGDAMVKMTQHTPNFPPPSIIPKTNKAMKLLDIDPLELARQLTIMESKLFAKIRPIECLNRGRDGKPGDGDDNISAIIDTSNKVAEWVADAVLSKDDSRRRAAIVKQFISVADRCRHLQNFSTMAALVAGLNSPPIRRLKRTWEQVNARSKAQLQEAERTMDTNKNFTNYRAILKQAQLPCVPFFGVYLSVLTFIQDGNKNMIQGDIINFSKREKFAEVIREIKHYQSKPYNLNALPPVQAFIDESLSALGNTADLSDRAWNLSLEREPREREDEKMARLLQESGFL